MTPCTMEEIEVRQNPRTAASRRIYHIPEALIREAHKNGRSYRSVARQVGCSGRYISYLAEKIGLPPRRCPQEGGLAWADEELEILREYGAEEVSRLQERLRRIGRHRTKTAIQNKRWSLRIAGEAPGREARDHYTQNDLVDLLGVDSRKVQRWIRQGKLAAKKHGDWAYSINGKALRAFLLDHPVEWEPGRCDKFWLVDLLRGKLE